MIKFYIGYSIFKDCDVAANEFYNFTYYELIDYCKKQSIPEDDIIGLDIDELIEYLQELLLDDISYEKIKKSIAEEINPFIFKNKNLFSINVDVISEEVVQVSYLGEITQENLLAILQDYGTHDITNTLGILTEVGIIPAFNVDSGMYEQLYIGILFDKKYTNESMCSYEEALKELIKDEELDKETLNNLNKLLQINED